MRGEGEQGSSEWEAALYTILRIVHYQDDEDVMLYILSGISSGHLSAIQ